MGELIEDPSLRGKRWVFKDRVDAGRRLAEALKAHVKQGDLVLAIPAGGVPVGVEVAKRCMLELDVAVVRKALFPWTTEAGFGAVAWNGRVFLNHEAMEAYGLTNSMVESKVEEARRSVERRLKELRVGRKPLNLKSRTVVLVDDGLASGYTMLAAVEACRDEKPTKIIVAVPTASVSAVRLLQPRVDLIVALNVRGGLIYAVADAYVEWRDLSDEEVKGLLYGFWKKNFS